MRRDGIGKCARLLSAVVGIALLGAGCSSSGTGTDPNALADTGAPTADDLAALGGRIDSLSTSLAGTQGQLDGLLSSLNALAATVAGLPPPPDPITPPAPVPTTWSVKLVVRDHGTFDRQQSPGTWDISVKQIKDNGRLGANTVFDGVTDDNGVVTVVVDVADTATSLYVEAVNESITDDPQTLHTIIPVQVTSPLAVDGDELIGWQRIDYASEVISKNLILPGAAFDFGIDPKKIDSDTFAALVEGIRQLSDVKSCLEAAEANTADCTIDGVYSAIRNHQGVWNASLHTVAAIANASAVMNTGSLEPGDNTTDDDNLGGQISGGNGIYLTHGGDGANALTKSLCGIAMTSSLTVNGALFGDTDIGDGSFTYQVGLDDEVNRGAYGKHLGLVVGNTDQLFDVFTYTFRAQNGLTPDDNKFRRACAGSEVVSVLNQTTTTNEKFTVKGETTVLEKTDLTPLCLVETTTNTLSSADGTEDTDGVTYRSIKLTSFDDFAVFCQQVGGGCEPSQMINGKTLSTFDDNVTCVGVALEGFRKGSLADGLYLELKLSGDVVTEGAVDTIRVRNRRDHTLALNGDEVSFRDTIFAASDDADLIAAHTGLAPAQLARDCKDNVDAGGPEGIYMATKALNGDFKAWDAVRLAAKSHCFSGTALANGFATPELVGSLFNGNANVKDNVGIPAGYLVANTLYKVSKVSSGETLLGKVLFEIKTDDLGRWVGAVPGLVAGDQLDLKADVDDNNTHFVIPVS